MIAITGANGQLGRLTIAALQRVSPSTPIVATVRSPEKAADLKGVEVRRADYDRPDTLASAFSGMK